MRQHQGLVCPSVGQKRSWYIWEMASIHSSSSLALTALSLLCLLYTWAQKTNWLQMSWETSEGHYGQAMAQHLLVYQAMSLQFYHPLLSYYSLSATLSLYLCISSSHIPSGPLRECIGLILCLMRSSASGLASWASSAPSPSVVYTWSRSATTWSLPYLLNPPSTNWWQPCRRPCNCWKDIICQNLPD